MSLDAVFVERFFIFEAIDTINARIETCKLKLQDHEVRGKRVHNLYGSEFALQSIHGLCKNVCKAKCLMAKN